MLLLLNQLLSPFFFFNHIILERVEGFFELLDFRIGGNLQSLEDLLFGFGSGLREGGGGDWVEDHRLDAGIFCEGEGKEGNYDGDLHRVNF